MKCTKTNCITYAKSYVANLSGKDLTDPKILLGLRFNLPQQPEIQSL